MLTIFLNTGGKKIVNLHPSFFIMQKKHDLSPQAKAASILADTPGGYRYSLEPIGKR